MSDVIETSLSFGDETTGRIILRGHDLIELAYRHSFEDVMALLWKGLIASEPSAQALGAARVAAFSCAQPLEQYVRGRPVLEAMRILVAAYSARSNEAPIRAVAFVGVAAALSILSADNRVWSPPDPAQGHAADLLAIATQNSAGTDAKQSFERYCIWMIDHGINASTYAGRIAASTGGDIGAGLVASLATLEGRRHGGAPSHVLDQLDQIAGPDDVARYTTDARKAGRRIMGFGSRAYTGPDIRVDPMRREWIALGGEKGTRSDAVAIESAFLSVLLGSETRRPLNTNVEYYAALLLEEIGLPRCGFTPMFAAARSAGWVAHMTEQQLQRRMIRPQDRYVGVAAPS